MTDTPKIAPVLDADDLGRLDDAPAFVELAAWRGEWPKVIAAAMRQLPDDHPAKITRAHTALLREAAEMIETEYDARDNASYHVVTLRAFADALESYLPPES